MDKSVGEFQYHVTTKLIFGKETVEKKLENEMKERGVKKVLLTYGGGSIKKIGLYDKVIKILKNLNIEVFECGGIKPNPRIVSVRKGVKLVKDNSIEFILAVGGGSTIDCTKAIARGSCMEEDVWTHYLQAQKAAKDKNVPYPVCKKAIPYGTILTLSATGSEMNTGSVISNLEEKKKIGIGGGENLLPRFSILDPEITYTVPVNQTKAGGVDIMVHCIEQFLSQNAPYFTDQMTLGTLKTMVKYLPIAVKEPKNYEARSNFMFAGTIGLNYLLSMGRGLTGWTTHLMEHDVSALYKDFTHGVGLAIILPGVLRMMLKKKPKLSIEKCCLLGEMFGMYGLESTVENANKVIDRLEEFFAKDVGIAVKFTDVEKDFDENTCKKLKEMWSETYDQVQGWESFSAGEVYEILKGRL